MHVISAWLNCLFFLYVLPYKLFVTPNLTHIVIGQKLGILPGLHTEPRSWFFKEKSYVQPLSRCFLFFLSMMFRLNTLQMDSAKHRVDEPKSLLVSSGDNGLVESHLIFVDSAMFQAVQCIMI